MPEFMVMIQESEAAERQLTPAETKALIDGRSAFERRLRAASVLLDGERLRPSSEAKRVSIRDGRPRVDSGPFGEAAMNAYFAIRADSLDAALALVEHCPISPEGALEVRPIMKGNHKPDKTSQQGRVFAFAVLGNAQTERGWIEIMDRIDATSREHPNDRAFAGLRLHAPGAGRRVVASGNQRTIFDGPFLECKEVIGGIFFMRAQSVSEAVEWACGTEFVKLGAVEIRELWEELTRTLDDVARHEKVRVVGALVRILGNIDAAEEAFQEAVVAALATWPANGIPLNPAAWLTSTAKNHARDAARHRRIVEKKAPLLMEPDMIAPETIESAIDDELRLIFTCCHPALTLESQVALTLKVVIGFSTDEIARAFLSPEKTIAQRVVRAKRTIEENALPYEVPDCKELPERLASVLAVVYLVFNEGHTTRSGSLMRLDLQAEALRLSRVLCDLLPLEAEVFGLFALIAFSFARAATRVDEHGDMLLLSQQDRARWDRAAIKEALMALERAHRVGGRGSYVVQAEIAAHHATAPTWEATDWAPILRSYDELLTLAPSPVVALNRAVAVCMHAGPTEGLAALAPLEAALSGYHLFHATRADFRRRLGLRQEAREDYQRALSLAGNDSERRFLRRQIDELDQLPM